MSPLLSVAESFLVSRVVGSKSPVSGKTKIGVGLAIMAAFFLLVAAGFFIVSAYLWLSSQYPPEQATAMAGLMVLILGLICAGGAYAIVLFHRMRVRKLKIEMTETLEALIRLTEGELLRPARNNPKTAALIAGIAGLIVGDQIL